MHILFLFLDGIGLGSEDPSHNPFVRAEMPTLHALLGGQPLLAASAPFHGDQATLLPLDACLGVEGLPQSATGQAVLLTGRNIPAEIGYHYGPKPNPQIAHYLNGATLFSLLKQSGKRTALLNAYPPRYFQGIHSGKRLYSAIPLAVTRAGVPLFTKDDLYHGRALSADFTGQGWRNMLGFADAPLFSPQQAGAQLARLARQYDFSLFEYWASDYAGHKQDMAWALDQLQTFDGVLAGLLQNWDEEGLILITSDHGNLEDLSTRRHTTAPVPALLLGAQRWREAFSQQMNDLTDIAPAILRLSGVSPR
jgi:hypothetical protein